MPNLTQLIPTSGLLAWHLYHAGASGNHIIFDSSGNNRHIDSAVPNSAVLVFDILNGQPGWYFNGTTTVPLNWTGSITPKHVFVLASHEDAAFNLNRGLLTGEVTGDVLVSNSSGTDFFDFGYTDFGYRKSDVFYTQNNQEAPMVVPELIEVADTVGFPLDGIQVGKQRNVAGRIWKGYFFEQLLYDRILTSIEKDAIKLYMNLKFGLWRSTALPMNFPIPGVTGINYRHFYAAPEQWDDTVESHKYEDGGMSFNETSDTAVREWKVEFDCVSHTHALAKAQYEIFDEFWNAVRTSRAFNFTDKYGTTHTGVRVKKYDRDHRAHKSWQNEAAFTLVKYP